MSKAGKIRTKRTRRRENRRLKFGNSAVPKHKRLGGRTGQSMRGEKSVRA
jgi:hypothetical protein